MHNSSCLLWLLFFGIFQTAMDGGTSFVVAETGWKAKSSLLDDARASPIL
jgi:hypothetical protein